MEKVVIADMGVEGGGVTIYGRVVAGAWSFWQEGSSMYLDENDDERWRSWTSEPVSQLSLALPDKWYMMYPTEVHPEFVAQLRSEYELCRHGEGGRGLRFQHDRWVEIVADHGQEKETARPPAKGCVRVSLQRVLGPGSQALQLPCSTDAQVAAFLEEIWRAMSPRVAPFTYGKVWVLREVHTSRVLDVGSSWAKSHGVASDTRTLADAGIVPRMELEVVPLVKV